MDEFVKATPGIKNIIDILQTLSPYERVEICADKSGKPDTMIVYRSTKTYISGETSENMK